MVDTLGGTGRARPPRMDRRLRIGMYSTMGPGCGIASYTEDLVGALTVHADVTTIPIRTRSVNPFRQVAARRRLTRHDIAHVQHTYSFFGIDQLSYTLLIRTLFAGMRVPLVLTAHTVREPGPTRLDGGLGSRCANALGAPAWLDVKTFQRPDAVIVHTELHKQRLIARHIASDRIHVIPPGIPARIEVHASLVERFRSRFGIPREARTVGVFGFVDQSKRLPDVLAAVASLPQRPFLLLAGGPRLAAHALVQRTLSAQAERRGAGDRFAITGYLQPAEIPVALEAMDVVVVPYATDQSMSYSLHHALGQGRPVIGSDLPTFREIQDRASCLALVRPGDPEHLRETLDGLLEDAQARSRLAALARSYAAREDVTVAAARTMTVYRQVHQNR